MKLTLTLILLVLFSLIYSQDDVYLLQTFKKHKGEVKALGFSKDSKVLASGGQDKALFIIDVESGEILHEHHDNYYPIADLEFYGNKQLFITSGSDIKLIDLENNTLALYQGNATYFWSLDFALERSKLTGGSYDKKIKVWDVNTQKIELVLDGHEKSALSVAFSADEKYIVSGSLDLSIKVWNALDGTLLHSYEKHSGNIFDVEFHPNTRYFASASDDKTIRLWDIEQGKVIKTYAGHDAAVLNIEFSPDGYFMYSSSVDGVVYVWEVRTGAKLYSYNTHTGAVYALAVSNDGNYVATGGDDSKVCLWNSAKLIAVEYYFLSEFEHEKGTNPIFDDRRHGESKEAYEERQKEAKVQMQELIEKYFTQYRKKQNFKNIPDNESN